VTSTNSTRRALSYFSGAALMGLSLLEFEHPFPVASLLKSAPRATSSTSLWLEFGQVSICASRKQQHC